MIKSGMEFKGNLMKIKLYQIDAFTQQLFRGNPAAVCPLETWLDDDILQAIAEENQLSETGFIVPRGNDYHIRWFTPTMEIDLCGHGTLAAAYVVLQELEPGREYVTFHSASGPLHVAKNGEALVMDFPIINFEACEAPLALAEALGAQPQTVYCANKYLAVMDSEKTVRELKPNMALLKKLEFSGVIVTARGEHVDFVSRYFAPKEGIDEDPVTGSAHCLLAPYWSEQLGISKLKAQQLSKRGGEIFCEVKGERVLLTGYTKLYLSGQIELS